MRVLLLTGDTPRQLYFNLPLLAAFQVVGVVMMGRESTLPAVPPGTDPHDAMNFRRHFAERHVAELGTFGDLKGREVFAGLPVIACEREDLNGPQVCAFIRAQAPDLVVITGTGMVREPLFAVLPDMVINVHIGLSPWYRGAAGLFWPFYNLEPAWTGVTLHRIDRNADSGPILHQCSPGLRRGDGIHDVAVRAVTVAREDLVRLVTRYRDRGRLDERPQKVAGRLYLTSAFRPEHLRIIYDMFDNRMVDRYLDGDLARREPTLIRPNLPEAA